MSKTITINKDFLTFSAGKSRKKRDKTDNPGEIKVKSPKQRAPSIKRNKVMQFIRQQQEENMKKMLEGDTTKIDDRTKEDIDTFQNGFSESINYFKTLEEETKKKEAKHNETIRHRVDQVQRLANPTMFPIPQVLNSEIPTEILTEPFDKISGVIPPLRIHAPKWGCLKGGQLPTYRAFQKTQKVYPSQPRHPAMQVVSGPSNSSNGIINNGLGSMGGNNTLPLPSPNPIPSLSKPQIMMNEIQQTKAKMDQINNVGGKRLRNTKQRRIIRRTYKTGKSKIHPKISVLVSNRTIRNKTTETTQLLKQKPMNEIRRELIKRGLIRVGTIAPNDVLRKMYESMTLICGEVQNHNPENLLYNFFNDNEGK
jgi:hypothetical protein